MSGVLYRVPAPAMSRGASSRRLGRAASHVAGPLLARYASTSPLRCPHMRQFKTHECVVTESHMECRVK